MEYNRDKILRLFLSLFRENARINREVGSHLDIEDMIETSLCTTIFKCKNGGIAEKIVRETIWSEEEELRQKCRNIILDFDKRTNLLDIRMTGVNALLDDFVKRSGFDMEYNIRRNSTVGITVRIPSTGQRLIFNPSFKKVMSDGWLDSLQKDLDAFINLAGKFGRIRVTNG